MNFFRFFSFPANLTSGAYKVVTLANVAAAVGVVGTVAAAVGNNQPLLNALFGQQKGATISLISIALSHAAATITAHGDPIGVQNGPATAVAVSSSGDASPTTLTEAKA